LSEDLLDQAIRYGSVMHPELGKSIRAEEGQASQMERLREQITSREMLKDAELDMKLAIAEAKQSGNNGTIEKMEGEYQRNRDNAKTPEEYKRWDALLKEIDERIVRRKAASTEARTDAQGRLIQAFTGVNPNAAPTGGTVTGKTKSGATYQIVPDGAQEASVQPRPALPNEAKPSSPPFPQGRGKSEDERAILEDELREYIRRGDKRGEEITRNELKKRGYTVADTPKPTPAKLVEEAKSANNPVPSKIIEYNERMKQAASVEKDIKNIERIASGMSKDRREEFLTQRNYHELKRQLDKLNRGG